MAGPIRISILANASQAQRAMDSTASRATRLGDTFRRMAAPSAAIAGGIALVGKASVQAASDAQQSLGATQTVFGKYADQVIKSSNDAALALGLSANEYRELSNVTGALLSGAGVPLKNLAGLTSDLNKRAADMAATFGGTTREAVEAISSLLKGEADPIERYGVSIKQSDVSARLAAKGLDKLTGRAAKQAEMTERLALLTEKTSKLQGAFGRESGTLANQQQKAAAQVENLKAQLGTALLPALTKVVRMASKAVGWFSEHQTVAKVLVGVLGGLAVAILAVNAAMAINPVTLVVAGLVGLVAALVVTYKKSETFRNIVNDIGTVIRTQVWPALQAFGQFVVTQLVPQVVQIARAVGQRLKPILDQAAISIRQDVAPAIAKAAAKFREWWPTIKRVIAAVVQMYGRLLTFYATVLGKVIPVVIRLVVAFYSRVIPAVIDVIGHVAKIIRKMVEFGQAFFRAGQKVADFVTKVKTKIGEVIQAVLDLPGRASSALGDLTYTLVQKGRDLLQGFINGLKEKIGEIGDLLSDLPGKALNAIGLRTAAANGRVSLRAGVLFEGDGTKGSAVYRQSQRPVINVTVTAPVGSSPADVGRELRRYLDAFEGPGGRRRAY